VSGAVAFSPDVRFLPVAVETEPSRFEPERQEIDPHLLDIQTGLALAAF